MYSDTIADMLTRIRNGYMAKKAVVVMPHSKMKEEIGKILVKHHYLKAYKLQTEGKKTFLEIEMDYAKGQAAITEIEKISKIGRHIYRSSDKLPYVLSGQGIAIISTSKGMMTADEARQQKLGGEVICKVW